jgi:Flp pilus assembly protein TadB
VNDLAVLAIPTAAVAGVVLLTLGLRGTPARPARRRAGRARDWLAQAGVRGVRPWQVVALCGALGGAAGLGVLAMSGSVWLGLAFAGLAGVLPVSMLRARRQRRSRELREVWPDAIDNLASGVRAGLSLPEAVAGLTERGPEPLRAPLARFADDYHATGRSARRSTGSRLSWPTRPPTEWWRRCGWPGRSAAASSAAPCGPCPASSATSCASARSWRPVRRGCWSRPAWRS